MDESTLSGSVCLMCVLWFSLLLILLQNHTHSTSNLEPGCYVVHGHACWVGIMFLVDRVCCEACIIGPLHEVKKGGKKKSHYPASFKKKWISIAASKILKSVFTGEITVLYFSVYHQIIFFVGMLTTTCWAMHLLTAHDCFTKVD